MLPNRPSTAGWVDCGLTERAIDQSLQYLGVETLYRLHMNRPSASSIIWCSFMNTNLVDEDSSEVLSVSADHLPGKAGLFMRKEQNRG